MSLSEGGLIHTCRIMPDTMHYLNLMHHSDSLTLLDTLSSILCNHMPTDSSLLSVSLIIFNADFQQRKIALL